jgi:hypothetical protein
LNLLLQFFECYCYMHGHHAQPVGHEVGLLLCQCLKVGPLRDNCVFKKY